MSAEIQHRFQCSLKRVGCGLGKNARWFLKFSESSPDSLDSVEFDDCWDDVITLAQQAAKEGPKHGREPLLKVRLSPGSTLNYSGRTYKPGTVVEVPESIAVSLVRGASAGYVDPPPVVSPILASPTTALNSWEGAARWHEGHYDTRHMPKEERPEYHVCRVELRSLHGQIRSAIESYLAGHEAILLLKDVYLRLGSSQLLATPPFSVMHATASGLAFSGVEAPVIVRFAQVFQATGRLFRRCPDPDCHKLFLASRTKQRFCSGNHRARAGMKALRKKRAEEKAQRLAREQQKQMKVKHEKGMRKTVKRKKPKQRKGGKHGTKR